MKLSDVPPPAPRSSGYDCVFAAVHKVADDADRAWIAANIANPNASDAWVAGQITEHLGVRVNHQAVARHRRGQCIKCRDAERTWL